MNPISKFVLNILKENKKRLIWIIAIATFGSLLAATIPLVYGKLFDLAVIPQTALSLLFSLILLWVLLGLISNYTTYKTSYAGEVLGHEITFKEEAKAYYHYITLPIAFHKRKRKGEILNKISRGTWHIYELIQSMSRILPQVLILIFSIIIMVFMKWQLALALIFSFFIYILLTIKMIGPILKIENKLHEVANKQYGVVYNRLENIFLIKNFGREEEEKKKLFNFMVLKTMPVFKENSKRWAKLSLYQGLIYTLSLVLVLGASIFFLRSSAITPGQFVMFFGYVNLAFGPFWELMYTYRAWKQSSVAIKRLIKLKQTMPEAMKHGDAVLKETKGNIEFEHISFGYSKEKKVLENLNLKVKAGENIAIVGKSGVGKTTLLELLIGYYKPSTGRILLDGIDISRLKLSWLRDQIATVPQDISLFHESLLDNLRYANPKITREEIIEATKAASAHEFIIRLPKEYDTIIGERGMKLSVGQRQRIALAMAFLKKPKILILDEPTAALDAESEKKVKEGIQRLIKGKTTFIIAHRFSTVKNADKIIVLDKGRIAEVGNHRELIAKKGIYYNFYTLQTGLN